MYQPIKLDYELNAFEPLISEETMDLHYNTIYKEALQKLNEVLKNNNFNFSYPVEELYKKIEDFPLEARSDIIYNAGAVVNHELFFKSLTNIKENNLTVPEPLNNAILKNFGSYENLKDEIAKNSSILPGSGFTFIILTEFKELFVINLPNYDDPLFFNLSPILTIDVWEHAYYLDNYNDKEQYLENIFKLINYKNANENYVNTINKLDKTKNN